LIGRLLHELHTVTKPIPWGFKIQFDLVRNPDDIFIEKFDGDTNTNTYKTEMTDIYLLAPKVTLSEVVCEELLQRWKTKKEDLVYNYRRFHVSTINVGHSNHLQTPSLFSGTHPSRIYFAISTDEAWQGSQTTSPYQFFHKWTYTKQATDMDWQKYLERQKIAQEQKGFGDLKNMIIHIAEKFEQQNDDENLEDNPDNPEPSTSKGLRSKKGKGQAPKENRPRKKMSFADILKSYWNKDVDEEESISSASSLKATEGSEVNNVSGRLRSHSSKASDPSIQGDPSPEPFAEPFQLATTATVHLTKCALMMDGQEWGKFKSFLFKYLKKI
jgi:hypothetical protein